jgi:anhydro-N-acetylmuramic acid kinase
MWQKGMKMKEYRVIGLMSGTSLDGIDAALITTDGEGYIVREGFAHEAYPEGLRQHIRSCLNLPCEKRGIAAAVERELTEAHARVIQKLLSEKNLGAQDIDLIGFHGQTIAHIPQDKFTCQLGDGALLARLTGIKVVNDFRTADVLAGGQGAPLAPVYHRALSTNLDKPVAFLNIGGVANVTYIGTDGAIIAFDTGPGNALMDDWMLQHAGQKYDDGGKIAASGKVDEDILGALMSHPFFDVPPPKSLDRNDFVSPLWQGLTLAAGAATLSAFTAHSIVKALDFLPTPPARWIVSGGGRLNSYLIQQLREKLGVPVNAIEDVGFNGDAIEAEAFAYMAVRSVKGLPISFPTTTGVPHPMPGGKLNLPEAA